MNSSKTFTLIKSLQKKEIQAFEKSLADSKRKSTLDLFKICKKLAQQEKNIKFIDLYKLFYKKEYDKKNDNAFRNELRLLNATIENFIVKQQLEKLSKKDSYFRKKLFLEHLLEKESYHLFEKEFAKLMKQIENNDDYIYMSDFLSQWMKYQNKNLKIEQKHLEQLKLDYKKYFDFWRLEVGLKTKKMEVFKSFADRFSFMMDRTIVFDESIQALSFDKLNENKYFNYLQNKSLAFKLQGNEKVVLLKEMLKQCEEIKNYDFDFENERFSLLQSLGVEMMIQTENEKAESYFKESINNISSIDDKNLIKGIYNYTSVLIKLEKYDKAIKIYEQNHVKIMNSNFVDLFYCIITMCYIFINDIPKAESLNKIIDSNNSVGNYLYSRCNLAILHFKNKQYEIALTELLNINQSFNYHKNQDPAFLDFTSIFKSYIQISFSSSLINSNQNKLKELIAKSEANFTKSNMTYGGDSLHTHWLHKEIESKIKS